MTFASIPAGISLFVDANILIHHFGSDPVLQPLCQQLLEWIGRRELDGFTSTHALGEVAHRLMTIEAMMMNGWPMAGIAQRLRQHPGAVQKLTRFRQALQAIPQFDVRVLAIHDKLPDTAAAVSQQTGLLTNDALVVAVMQANGLSHLASIDPDFDRVPGLVRYAPS
jgi:predicted nucleic acid-binding protein